MWCGRAEEHSHIFIRVGLEGPHRSPHLPAASHDGTQGGKEGGERCSFLECEGELRWMEPRPTPSVT